jgi:hypothetical protein
MNLQQHVLRNTVLTFFITVILILAFLYFGHDFLRHPGL